MSVLKTYYCHVIALDLALSLELSPYRCLLIVNATAVGEKHFHGTNLTIGLSLYLSLFLSLTAIMEIFIVPNNGHIIFAQISGFVQTQEFLGTNGEIKSENII